MNPILETEPGSESSVVARSEEAKALQRKLSFWRRTAWLLLGSILVVIVVLLGRDLRSRNSCRNSLTAFGQAATRAKIETTQPIDLIESEWAALPPTGSHMAGHYEIIVDNWLKVPGRGDRIPLAICGHSHGTLLGTGRYVLFRSETGDTVEWLQEVDTAAIVRQAMIDVR